MEKRWSIQGVDTKIRDELARVLKIRPIYCQLLAHRGIATFEQAKTFFRPNIKGLHSPFEMKGMQKAVHRIDQALRKKEKILVYGDYDVDGTTAIATVYSFLKDQYPHNSIDFYSPDRYNEGYGISLEGIREAEKNNISLIIVLDCGIKAVEQIKLANSLCIDIIVCDHHLPGEKLPKAWAILNPKQRDCPYPYKELSGCGIGFKLISALSSYWDLAENTAFKYIDLVATSTAADIVPMTGENRILTFLGLKKINEHPLPAIKALIEVSGLQQPLSIQDVVFMLAPRINAAGRITHAREAISLLIEKDKDKALSKAEHLQQLNENRKKLDQDTAAEIIKEIETHPKLQSKSTTVMFHPDWHKGIIGIAASRVMETYYRPTIILSKHNGEITGSARSVKGFNIHEALKSCASLMEKFGGHQFAAGMTLKPDKIDQFADKFERVVANTITPDLLIQEIKIDAEVTFDLINNKFYNLLSQFEPFGPENDPPIFLIKGVQDTGYSKILKSKHIRFELHHPQFPEKYLSGIGFRMAERFDALSSGKPIDICFHLEKNNFNGQSNLQLRIIDFRHSKD